MNVEAIFCLRKQKPNKSSPRLPQPASLKWYHQWQSERLMAIARNNGDDAVVIDGDR